jgi:hypothetical protein
MPKICFVADVHCGSPKRFGGPVRCGVNDRGRRVLDVFSRAADRAVELRAEAFVVCGDLFDSSLPPPQLLTEVQAPLRRLREAHVEVVLLVGNHDQESAAPGDHALGPLAPYARVVERPECVWLGPVALLCLPHRRGREGRWVDEEVRVVLEAAPRGARARDVRRVLALHAGVVDERTPAFMRGGAVAVDHLHYAMTMHSMTHAFAGDHHVHRRWGDVVQLGALAGTGFDNAGLDGYGALAVLDVDSGAVDLEFLPGPRFVSARLSDPVFAEVERRAGEHVVYLEFLAGATEDARLEEAALIYLKGIGAIVDGEVVRVGGPSAEPARTAAVQAIPHLGAALASFVAAMPLPEEVSREAVLDAARAHLKRG